MTTGLGTTFNAPAFNREDVLKHTFHLKSYSENTDAVSDVEAANQLIDAWIAYRDMAAEILVTSLNLDSPREVLGPSCRGNHELPGTGWNYRTHGIGVDMVRKNGHGGIDFDFCATPGKLFAHPDWWRLCVFMRRVIHDKSVDTSAYGLVIARPQDFEAVTKSLLEKRRPK